MATIDQGGNSFGATMDIGTNDGYSMNFKTSNNLKAWFDVTTPHFWVVSIANQNAANNAVVRLDGTGTQITRNVADSGPALKVNQVNAGSTGNTLILQKAGSDQLSMSSTGVFKVNNLAGIGDRIVTADSAGNLGTGAEVSSGTYTPTTNMTPSGTATPVGFTYIRVGDIVQVSGRLNCTGITSGISSVEVTLPVPSLLSAASDLQGVVTGNGLSGASPNYVIGVPGLGANYALVDFFATSGSPSVYIQFQYQVL